MTDFETFYRLDFLQMSLGMVLYVKHLPLPIICTNATNFMQEWSQLIQITIDRYPLSFVYIHPHHVEPGLLNLQQYMHPHQTVMGDLNVNTSTTVCGKLMANVCSTNTLQMSPTEPTRNDSHLDHILLPHPHPFHSSTETYFKLYSDHKAICLRIEFR